MAFGLMSDFRKYPECFIDYEHCDRSWIDFVRVLEAIGVENRNIHMITLQEGLRGVDPHDENLTDEQKTMVAVECANNLWYFARKVVRIPVKGARPCSARMNRMFFAMLWCMIMNIDIAAIAPRQNGKSMGFDVDMTRTTCIAGENQDMFLVTKDAGLRKVNVDRIKSLRDELPGYLNFTTGHDTDNSEIVTCKALGNRLLTGVAQASKILADNLGRGLTSALLRFDEFGYIVNLAITFPVAAAAGTEARTNAKKNGTAYGIGIATTPASRATTHGAFAYNVVHDGYYWSEKLIDFKSRDEIVEFMLANSNGDTPLINCTMSHRQLGRTDDWLREQMLVTRGTEESLSKDYLNVWPNGKASGALDPEMINVLKASEKAPLYTERYKSSFEMRWYRDDADRYLKDSQTILSIDTSNSSGSDANGMTVRCIKTLEVIGTSNVRVASILTYGIWIAELMVQYPRMVLVVENKSTGQAIMDIVAEKLIELGINPFKRMYNRIVDDPVVYAKQWKIVQGSKPCMQTYLEYKRYFGVMTTGPLRAFMFSTVLQAAVKSTGHLTYDRELVAQFTALEFVRGRVDHPTGGHDDLVISYLMTTWVLAYGKNLYFYGLKSSEIMVAVSEEGAVKTEKEIQVQKNDAVLMGIIEKLKLEHATCKDKFQKRLLEVRIGAYVKKLSGATAAANMNDIMDTGQSDEKKRILKAVEARKKLAWLS